MNISERIIKISGSAIVPNDLKLGDDVTITVAGSVVKVEHLDNQDGTENIRFVVKAMTVNVQ